MSNYAIGLDIGTSSVKAGLLDLSTFKICFLTSREYDNSAEQKSRVLWAKTLEILKEIGNQSKDTGKLTAIGLSGQMHGTVLYDTRGKIIDPIINWQDRRCDKPLKKYRGASTIEVIEKILGKEVYKYIGIDKISSGFMGATLFYLKENDSDIFDKIKHVLLPTDFIRKKMILEKDYKTDQTNASSTGLFNVRYRKWHQRIIRELGLPKNIFPKISGTQDIAGHTCSKINKLLRLNQGVPVIVGGGDNPLSAFGSGLYDYPSPVNINIGTGAQISKVIDNYEKIEGIETRNFFNNMYLFVGASLGGGNSYKNLKENINLKVEKKLSFEKLNNLAKKIVPGSERLRFCTGPSRINPKRPAGFFGNEDIKESLGHMARAVMEGVLFDLYEFYSLMGKTSEDIIIGSGKGLSESYVWPQIAADMFNRKVRVTDFESAVFGSALMAARSAGKISSLDKTFKSIKYIDFEPSLKNSNKYSKLLKEGYFYEEK